MTPLSPAFLSKPIAHRGLHDAGAGRPENSLAATRAAMAQGYGIELDVQLSADGEAMVFHDATLDRMTAESGALAKRTAEDLSTIPLKGGFPEAEGIPRLSDLLHMVAGQVPVLIEIKDQSGALGPTNGRLEEAVARALEQADHPETCAVMSFNPHSVAAISDAAPRIARGLTTERFEPAAWPCTPPDRLGALSAIEDYETLGCTFISHNHRHLTSPHVSRLKDLGATILTWTIRSPSEEAAARAIAQNITFEGYAPVFPGA